ncbi:MAG TPA: flavin reductase family protein [Beijerinckiaceae bacterium]|nr:flavin reductase family protein [Beijerinckiaceae bacterium]
MYEISFDTPLTDHRLLRNALGRFATGVAVITTRTPSGKKEGVTSNSFSAVSLDPPLVLWSLRREAPSLGGFLDSKCFAVSVLSSDQSELSRHFATAHPNKFDSMFHRQGLGDCPLLDKALATFECTVETTIPGGDHILFLGRVRRATYRDGEPLIFSAGTYYAPAPLACA